MTGRAKKINTDERKLAAPLFNHVWDLMEKKNRKSRKAVDAADDISEKDDRTLLLKNLRTI